jgi:hypothetical protein
MTISVVPLCVMKTVGGIVAAAWPSAGGRGGTDALGARAGDGGHTPMPSGVASGMAVVATAGGIANDGTAAGGAVDAAATGAGREVAAGGELLAPRFPIHSTANARTVKTKPMRSQRLTHSG